MVFLYYFSNRTWFDKRYEQMIKFPKAELNSSQIQMQQRQGLSKKLNQARKAGARKRLN